MTFFYCRKIIYILWYNNEILGIMKMILIKAYVRKNEKKEDRCYLNGSFDPLNKEEFRNGKK